MRKPDPREEAQKFREGLEHFNHRRFFEAHESWEAIWLTAAEPEKTFLQGIIQVAAAFHHYQRRNHVGTRLLLKAGLKKLERFPSEHRGIRVEKLRAAVRRWLAALAPDDPSVREEVPRIERVRRRQAARN